MTFIVLFFAFLSFLDRKLDKTLFHIEFIMMGVMLCFRYGQGTDYFGYEANYSLVPSTIDIQFLFHNNVHGEIGYTFLVEICKSMGLSFQWFVGIVSLTMMILTYKGIMLYGGKRTIAILMLFPTYYLTFYYGVRQGFALAIVVGVILPAYIQKKYVKAICFLLLGATIHSSLLIVLIPIVINRVVEMNRRLLLIGATILGITVGCFLAITSMNHGYVLFSPSISAILLRIILFIAITRLYKFSSIEDEVNERIYSFYLVGFCIYIALCPMAFLSHRLTAYMKISECILVSRLLEDAGMEVVGEDGFSFMKRHVYTLILAICMIEGLKNINSYLYQGEYYSDIHFYNYPYVSVFNKEKIYEFRENPFEKIYPDVFMRSET